MLTNFDLLTETEKLEKLVRVVNVLKQYNLDPWEASIKFKGFSSFSIKATYNGDYFEIKMIGNAFSVNVKSLEIKNKMVFYPKDLPMPKEISVHYDPDDLSPDVITILKEKGSIIISPKEIIYSGVGYTPPNNFFSKSPHFVLMYSLQKPNEKYSTCNAAIDPIYFDPNIFPYHDKQEEEGHYCIVNKPFPFIPSDNIESIVRAGHGLSIFLNSSNAEKERIDELLVGISLPLKTTITFDEIKSHGDGYNMFFSIYDPNRLALDNGNNRLQFNHYAENLEEGVTKILPHFLKFYQAFTQ